MEGLYSLLDKSYIQQGILGGVEKGKGAILF